MSYLQLVQITPEELSGLINQSLKSEIENLIKGLSKEQESGKEFLTRKETAAFFSVSVVTIHSWINDGLITPFKMGNRTYFRKAELVEKLLNSNRRAS